MKSKALIIPLAIVLFILYQGIYIVDETQQVVITQFGKPVGDPITKPGLNFKVPFIQAVNYFPKNLLQWDGDPSQIPTLDKTYIYVDTFARWKVVDPLKFFQTVNNVVGGLARLDDIIDAAVRNFIAKNPLIETVRWTNRELDVSEIGVKQVAHKRVMAEITTGRQKIVKGILDQSNPKLKEFGILLIDVQIKRLNYVEEVRRSVYGRMIAERKQIAERFRSEGEGEARKVEGDRERDLKKITSVAYRKAQEIKGKADAEATLIYAQAYNKDPDFYSFLKTLDVYKETMGKDTSLVLSTDSDLLKYFKSLK
ncbi:MAG: protease modulator HflC [Deltaproteobacteria bacterium]|nr:protease modulator HflC [Deltaproteobacteria bacterium]MBW1738801.1 protease modulator HflC [Deltaproteobacteria bacterium]MBW1909183.1 protease modulator HflC [Deltaproteobacteria bacterium]MBW2033254.1 protease modulator HflC [Deltaproteobacteria bacterium]MBW2358975.1 protease modulator HflC [Deltaproteobacteria bacterium]